MSNLNSATPNLPEPQRKPIDAIKIAEPQYLINIDTLSDIEAVAELSFESLGGRELIQIVRNDLVKGQNTVYRPVKNLSRLAFDYRPDTLVFLQNSSKALFASYAINISNHLPITGTGPGGATVYIDEETRDLVIDLINVEDDYLVQLEILQDGQVFDDTIYVTNEESGS
jgi:hypothetical protein